MIFRICACTYLFLRYKPPVWYARPRGVIAVKLLERAAEDLGRLVMGGGWGFGVRGLRGEKL